MANDEIRLLPDHRVAHRDGDRVVGLATACATGAAVDRRLPALAGAVGGVDAHPVAVGRGALPAARDRGPAAAEIHPGASAAALARGPEGEARPMPFSGGYIQTPYIPSCPPYGGHLNIATSGRLMPLAPCDTPMNVVTP